MAMTGIYDAATHAFEPLHRFWEDRKTHRFTAGVLVLVFLAALLGIELARRGLLPPGLADITPTNHFRAVDLAFGLVLVIEVVSLIFAIPCSISWSVGKQIEILSLILLRSAFKDLAAFPEPISVIGHTDTLLRICSDAVGALAVFVILGTYYRLQRKHRDAITQGESRYCFVAAKKIIALALLAAFAGLGCVHAWKALAGGPNGDEFFPAFYTLLIFSDILIVFLSQRHLPTFRAIFRYSGFALTTVLIRLALSAPAYVNSLIGVAAAAFAVGVVLAYNSFYSNEVC